MLSLDPWLVLLLHGLDKAGGHGQVGAGGGGRLAGEIFAFQGCRGVDPLEQNIDNRDMRDKSNKPEEDTK